MNRDLCRTILVSGRKGCLEVVAGLIFGLVQVQAAPAPGSAPHVAILDFDGGDDSYRNRTAAVDFTAALPTQLTAMSDVIWVEREQLHLAERELKMAGLGFGDAATALRLGKWAKADLLLTGRFGWSDAGYG